MAHLLSRENKPELCLFVRFSSNIICGPTRSVPKTIDIFASKMNQKFPHKPQHSVDYVVQEERVHDNTKCCTLIPSFHSLRMERLGP